MGRIRRTLLITVLITGSVPPSEAAAGEDDLPTFRVTRSDPSRCEPGVTLFSLFRWEDDVASTTFGAFVAVDVTGKVVWQHRVDSPAAAIKPLTNGNFAYIHGIPPVNIREIDRDGTTVRAYRATALPTESTTALDQVATEQHRGPIPVDADTFHHDLFPLPSGNLTVLSTEVRTLERFSLDMQHPRRNLGTANVVGDVIAELTPRGEIVQRWRLLDILDPLRITYGSHDHFWDTRAYGHIEGGTHDWSHANTVIRDPKDGGVIVSLRHQDAIVKIDAKTSAVRWILGTPSGWRHPLSGKLLKPKSRLEWPYHAHGVELTPQGTLLMFDNGNRRAIPPSRPLRANETYSRAVEFRVDETAMTVEQVWSYGGKTAGDDRFYSPFLCDADWLPQTGNVLITDGARIADKQGQPVNDPPGDTQWARIVEVTHDDPAEVVWEFVIDERETNPSVGWSIYRAERIPASDVTTE